MKNRKLVASIFKKKAAMVTASFKAPKWMLEEVKKQNLNMGEVCRRALVDILKIKE